MPDPQNFDDRGSGQQNNRNERQGQNSGNFANDPARASEAGKKGGQSRGDANRR